MKEGIVVYTNPLSKFLWESGIAYGFWVIVVIVIVSWIGLLVWDVNKKK